MPAITIMLLVPPHLMTAVPIVAVLPSPLPPLPPSQVDAPLILRKGLPRAFPGLEEIESEGIKEWNQYKSRVFQAPPQLMQGEPCDTHVLFAIRNTASETCGPANESREVKALEIVLKFMFMSSLQVGTLL